MKLLFIFTGGTIGSCVSDGKITVKNTKPYLLIEKYREKYSADFDFDTLEPFSVLSENSNGDVLKKLICTVKENIGKGYDGIIVTHGTDTLQYSAAALSYTLGLCEVPVCLVSSNFVLDDERANGTENLHGAVNFIRQRGGKGVFVAYKNTGDAIKIHRASRLLASSAFSDDVCSAENRFFGEFDSEMNFIKNPAYSELFDEMPPLSENGLTEQSDSIMRIEHYVGMRYPEISEKTKYILLGSYHSGTIDTDSQKAAEFFNEMKRRNVKVFLTGIYGDLHYESTRKFSEFGIIPLKNISPIAAYIKLWLAADQNNPENIIKKSLGGDLW